MAFRTEGMHQGSVCDRNGDPVDSGPPIDSTEDGRLTRAPLLTMREQDKAVAAAEERFSKAVGDIWRK